jgi:hypothetical protein
VFILVLVLMSRSWSSLFAVPAMVSFSIPISYMAFVFLGLPRVGFLRRRNGLNAITLTFSGALLGAVVGALFIAGFGLFLGTFSYGSPSDYWLAAAWGAGFGASIALTYGAITRWA